MDALMIIILLTFTPIEGTKNVGISYEAKLGLTTMERCLRTSEVLTESPPPRKDGDCAEAAVTLPATTSPNAASRVVHLIEVFFMRQGGWPKCGAEPIEILRESALRLFPAGSTWRRPKIGPPRFPRQPL